MTQTKCVGLVVQPTRTYCRRIVDGIVSVGAQAGWEHILVPSNVSSTLETLGTGVIDGYIGHFSDPALVDQVRRTGSPAVDISSVLPDSTLPRVATDEVAVGRLAAAYLLSLGLPRFGFLGDGTDYASQARSKGFEETIKTAGFSCHTFIEPGANNGAASASVAGDLPKWIQSLPKPIGMFSSSDTIGLELLALCRKLGISVPTEATVVGVGNDDLICGISNPPLTSIALATQRIGFDAARMLATLMEGKNPPATTILIPPVGVIPRQSSALPAILDPDVAATVSYIALHAQDGLRVQDLLRNIPMSRASMDQKFKKALGRTPANEIRRAQIELVKKLLRETQEAMDQVSAAAGFSNAKQMSATFHREVGTTPTAYRRRPLGAEDLNQ